MLMARVLPATPVEQEEEPVLDFEFSVMKRPSKLVLSAPPHPPVAPMAISALWTPEVDMPQL